MKQLLLIVAPLLLVLALAPEAQALVKLGAGIHYLHSLEQIKDSEDFDENSIGYLASVRFGSLGVKVEGLAEYIPDYLGFNEALIMPQAYVLLGGLIYAGAGAGWGYYNEDWTDDPFYALRAGVNPEFGMLGLDVFATYRFMKWKTIEGLENDDFNSMTFGAIVRFTL